ncbi:MAG TPA: hypothetical protein VHY08_15795 [Bacillota bacterium]|nr:hypothetical protein [Bacillota bacterium]
MPLYRGKLRGKSFYDRQDLRAQWIQLLTPNSGQAQAITQYKITWSGAESIESKIIVYLSFDGITWSRVKNGVWTDSLPDNSRTCVKVKVLLYTKNLHQSPVLDNIKTELKTATIQDGPIIPEAVFNYIPVTDCLNSLAEKIGFWWNIDMYKRVNFVSKITYTAPWTVTALEILDQPVVTHGNPQYRNKQYVLGGKGTTDALSEIKIGDGESKSFTVGFSIAEIIRIELSTNGGQTFAPCTFGIKGDNNETRDWYWEKGDSVITSDNALGNNYLLKITYKGQYPIIGIYSYGPAIDNLRAIEGSGSGIVENVVKEEGTDKDSALQNAVKLVEQYGVDGRKLQFKTDRKGLKPGQLLMVDLPRYGLNHDSNRQMLIESIQVQDDVYQLFYDVTAVEGPIDGSWAKFFYNLLKASPSVIRENINDNEILTVVYPYSKTWAPSDDPNIFHTLYPADTLYPGFTLYPQFAPENRLEYVALMDEENHELYRSAAKSQTGTDTNTITTTFIIQPSDWEGSFEKLSWYSGTTATLYRGSGVKVDEVDYSHVKTNAEAIQIIRTDTKGW